MLFLPGALLLVSAFSLFAQADDENDDKTRIIGSGNVITRNIPVTSFNELEISGVFSVWLTQGDKEEVKIEAEDNLQDLFEVKNEGSQLSVSMKKHAHFNSKKKMKVYITFKKLKSMDLKTVGNVSSDNDLKFDELKIDNTSVGNVKLNGMADRAVIRNKGVGNFEASRFVVQKMDIENTGVGSAEVNAEKEIKVKDSFLGKVVNRGNAPIKRMNRVRI